VGEGLICTPASTWTTFEKCCREKLDSWIAYVKIRLSIVSTDPLTLQQLNLNVNFSAMHSQFN
jgi:hypothetical protein